MFIINYLLIKMTFAEVSILFENKRRKEPKEIFLSLLR